MAWIAENPYGTGTLPMIGRNNAVWRDGEPFGSDTCKEGFVWRDAFANDHVCVTPAERGQAVFDNLLAPSRRAWPRS